MMIVPIDFVGNHLLQYISSVKDLRKYIILYGNNDKRNRKK